MMHLCNFIKNYYFLGKIRSSSLCGNRSTLLDGYNRITLDDSYMITF